MAILVAKASSLLVAIARGGKYKLMTINSPRSLILDEFTDF